MLKDTILDSGVDKGQNVVVDGADRLRNGQAVVASVAQQHGGHGSGQGGGGGSGNNTSAGSGKPATKVQQ